MNTFQPYQNRMMQPYPIYPQSSYQPNNGINWVQGMEGAKAWQLAPNSNVVLLDSDIDGRFYIKVSDNVGMCTLRTFKYEEITNQPPLPSDSVDMTRYVTREELQSILDKRLRGGKGNGKQFVPTDDAKPVISE